MIIFKKPPINFSLVNNEKKLDKCWQDWFLDLSQILLGSYETGNGYVIDNSTVSLNKNLDINETEYILPVNVNNGTVSVINYDNNNNFLQEYKVFVENNKVILPTITNGFYNLTGILIRRK